MGRSEDWKAFSREIVPVRRLFEAWRRTRNGRRIPERLWAEAARVAAAHGLSRTARALRLNVRSLRSRLPTESAGRGTEVAGGFVEVAVSPLPTGADRVDYVLEVEAAGGSRLRLEVRGTAGLDVAELARSFVAGERCSR